MVYPATKVTELIETIRDWSVDDLEDLGTELDILLFQLDEENDDEDK